MPRKALDDERVKAARELKRKGYTLEEISRELGISVGAAWKYTHDLFDDRLNALHEAINAIVNGLASVAGYVGMVEDDELWSEVFDPIDEAIEKFHGKSRRQ